MDLYFDENIESNDFILNITESKHCINVLRKRNGDIINVTDGKGSLYITHIIDANAKKCQLELENKTTISNTFPHIHIAIAPTKNIDRLEWFLEKATEIGISEITPLYCSHSERKHIRHDRLDKIVIAAMKQSLKYFKPTLNELTPFSDFIAKENNTNKYIAHCSGSERHLLQTSYNKNKDATLLIGPEGDFSIDEITKALNAGFKPVSLGNNRLRTETAGVVGVATFAFVNEI